MGLQLVAPEANRLAQLTTVLVPDTFPAGMDEAGCRRALLDDFDIEIGGGAGQLAGKVWRIGCMGNTARPRNVEALLGALRTVLER
jgi:alanine-glyoxylate transaminase/serine-glyoxylate transaminase/serine-pyruvate transaminase